MSFPNSCIDDRFKGCTNLESYSTVQASFTIANTPTNREILKDTETSGVFQAHKGSNYLNSIEAGDSTVLDISHGRPTGIIQRIYSQPDQRNEPRIPPPEMNTLSKSIALESFPLQFPVVPKLPVFEIRGKNGEIIIVGPPNLRPEKTTETPETGQKLQEEHEEGSNLSHDAKSSTKKPKSLDTVQDAVTREEEKPRDAIIDEIFHSGGETSSKFNSNMLELVGNEMYGNANDQADALSTSPLNPAISYKGRHRDYYQHHAMPPPTVWASVNGQNQVQLAYTSDNARSNSYLAQKMVEEPISVNFPSAGVVSTSYNAARKRFEARSRSSNPLNADTEISEAYPVSAWKSHHEKFGHGPGPPLTIGRKLLREKLADDNSSSKTSNHSMSSSYINKMSEISSETLDRSKLMQGGPTLSKSSSKSTHSSKNNLASDNDQQCSSIDSFSWGVKKLDQSSLSWQRVRTLSSSMSERKSNWSRLETASSNEIHPDDSISNIESHRATSRSSQTSHEDSSRVSSRGNDSNHETQYRPPTVESDGFHSPSTVKPAHAKSTLTLALLESNAPSSVSPSRNSAVSLGQRSQRSSIASRKSRGSPALSRSSQAQRSIRSSQSQRKCWDDDKLSSSSHGRSGEALPPFGCSLHPSFERSRSRDDDNSEERVGSGEWGASSRLDVPGGPLESKQAGSNGVMW